MKIFRMVLILSFVPQISMADVTSENIVNYLPGKWFARINISGNIILESETTYYKNGKVIFNIKMSSINKNQKALVASRHINGEGKWSVQGTNVIIRITKSSTQEFFKIGQVMKDRVAFIGANKFSYVDEEGILFTEYKNCKPSRKKGQAMHPKLKAC